MNSRSHKTILCAGFAFTNVFAAAVTLSLIACSRSPEPDTPGQCPIDCSKAVIGSSDFAVEALSAPAAVDCGSMASGTVRAVDPILLMFRVTGTTAGEAGIPRRAISIQPVVSGAMDATASEKAGNVTKLGDGTYEPTRYIGIATPKEEWCTDACGVFSVEVTPICAPGLTNNVTVTPTSGAMATTSTSFTVSASSSTLNAVDLNHIKK